MLIRRQQFDALDRADRPRLLALVCAHLREHHAPALGGISDEELLRRVRIAAARAARYGFNSAASLAAFAATMFEVAPNFDRHPRIRAALLEPGVSADSRMLDLVHRTTERDWEEAERNSDPSVWEGV